MGIGGCFALNPCLICGAPIDDYSVTCRNKACIDERRRQRDNKRVKKLAERRKYDGFMRIPNLIKDARIKMGYSRDRLAELIGYTGNTRQQIIYNWERGERSIPLLKINILSSVLGIDPDLIRVGPLTPGETPEQRLRNARIQRGLSMAQLGVLLGYDANSANVTVYRWESGERPIPRIHIKTIANILGIQSEDLLP